MLTFVLSMASLGVFMKSGAMVMVGLSLMTLLLLSLPMSSGVMFVSMGLELDKIGLLLMFLSLWMTVIMVLVSGDMKLSSKSYKSFFSLTIVLGLVLILTFSVSDFIVFFFLFEMTMIPTLSMVIGWGYQPERLNAMFYMLVYTVVSSLPLLLVLLFSKSYGMTSYMFFMGGGKEFSLVIFLILVMGMLVKLPVYMLHLWLPKAHVEAPLAGSIVLAAILLKLGGYGILRFMFIFKGLFITHMDKLMMIGLLGAAFSSIVCARQTDVKSLIAYSSIAHMGVMLGALSTMNSLGFQGAGLMLISHGLSSSLLFFMAFMNYKIYNSRSSILISGLLKLWPSLSLMWFLGGLMSLGVPPSLNFVAEVTINSSVVLSGWVCGLVLSVSLFVGAIYSLYLYTSCSHGAVMSYSKITIGIDLSSMVNGMMHIYPGFMLIVGLFLFHFN